MSKKNVRRFLLLVPMALVVACKGGPTYPTPPPDPPPGDNQPTHATMQPAHSDTLHVSHSSG